MPYETTNMDEGPLTDLVEYFAARASKYDKVYLKPERQDDIESLAAMRSDSLGGHRILQIACGTGFWTERVARVAESVMATDINDEVFSIAKERLEGATNVQLRRADAYRLDTIDSGFSAESSIAKTVTPSRSRTSSYTLSISTSDATSARPRNPRIDTGLPNAYPGRLGASRETSHISF